MAMRKIKWNREPRRDHDVRTEKITRPRTRTETKKNIVKDKKKAEKEQT